MSLEPLEGPCAMRASCLVLVLKLEGLQTGGTDLMMKTQERLVLKQLKPMVRSLTDPL